MGFALLFFLFMIVLAWGLLRNKRIDDPHPRSYSVIVACRNEQNNLGSLLQSLCEIEYPDYEIILVDDASEDNTFAILEDFCKTNDRATCYRIDEKDENLKGKKAALTLGARKAHKQILLFTDADCIVPKNWLSSYDGYFSDRTGMVAGFSPEKGVSEFRNFTQLGSAATFAAPIGLGMPFSCTGRNLAIRRDAFFGVKGYEQDGHIPSGDDKGMLNRIHQAGYDIGYNPEAPVYTIPDRKTYDNQQLRRYSKFGQSRPAFQLAMVVALAYFIYLPLCILRGEFDTFLTHWLGLVIFWSANLHLHRQKFDVRHAFYLIGYPYYLIYWFTMGAVRKWKWK